MTMTTATTETPGLPRWGTAREFAADMDVSADTVRRWARQGRDPEPPHRTQVPGRPELRRPDPPGRRPRWLTGRPAGTREAASEPSR